MVIGIDTYHDTAKRGRSVAGIVASMNLTFTRYFTNWSFQEPGEELHNSLSVLTAGKTTVKLCIVFGTSILMQSAALYGAERRVERS